MNGPVPVDPELISYSGFLTYKTLSDEQLAAAEQVVAANGASVDVTRDWLEMAYSGRDHRRKTLAALRALASIIGDAEGEVVCEINVEEPMPALEFYAIRNGKLLRQKGRIVRDPAEEVPPIDAKVRQIA